MGRRPLLSPVGTVQRIRVHNVSHRQTPSSSGPPEESSTSRQHLASVPKVCALPLTVGRSDDAHRCLSKVGLGPSRSTASRVSSAAKRRLALVACIGEAFESVADSTDMNNDNIPMCAWPNTARRRLSSRTPARQDTYGGRWATLWASGLSEVGLYRDPPNGTESHPSKCHSQRRSTLRLTARKCRDLLRCASQH